MKRTILLAFATVLLMLVSSADAAKPFELFAWLEKMPGKPADIAAIQMPIMADARNFFDAEEGGGYSQEINEEKVIAWAEKYAIRTPSRLIIVDIEHLPHTSLDPQTRLDALAKIGHVIDLLHITAPGLRVGAYSSAVPRNFWEPVNYRNALSRPDSAWHAAKLPGFKLEYDAWRMQCSLAKFTDVKRRKMLGSFVSKTDILCPSIYTFYPGLSDWKIYSTENIHQAVLLRGKVIPFIWPHYHGSGSVSGWIPEEMFSQQLETCYKHADGVVVWNYGGDWDESLGWVKALRKFMERIQ